MRYDSPQSYKRARGKSKRKNKFTGAVIALILIIALIISAVFIYDYVIHSMYPIKYEQYVEQYSEEYDVDKFLVYALIKCESGFNPDAHSHADAKGLMQITDETFADAQKDQENLSADKLFDPETNIKYGIKILSSLLSKLGEREAIAAYNAGYGKVSSWLSDPKYSTDGKTLDTIPYEETKNHVDKVLKARNMYKRLYDKKEK